MCSEQVAISARGISKTYFLYRRHRDRVLHAITRGRTGAAEKFHALREVSFEVARGETLGVIGRNGSGKSTLLQVLAGTVTPTTGEVRTSGRIAALLELGAGFDPEFTGRENVYLSAALLGMSREQTDARFEQIAAFADLGEFIEQPVKTYSSGMFVRLAFAVQVHSEPEIFLIDEAMAVGDHRFVQKCYRRMNELKAGGASLMLVSHDTTAVKMLCDRAMWLDGGEIRMIGPAAAVVDAYRNWSDNIDEDVIVAPGSAATQPDLRLRVHRVTLHDATGAPRSGFVHGERVTLRLSIENRSLPAGTPIRLGFSIRNNRGVEITGSNTDVTGADIRLEAAGVPIGVRIDFELPLLAGGDYAISVSIDSKDASGRHATEVLMPDCVVMQLDERVKVYTLLGIESRFSCELPAVQAGSSSEV